MFPGPPNQSNYYRPPSYYGGPTAPGPAEVTIDSITVAWNIVKADFGLWVPSALIIMVVTYAVQIPSSLLQNYFIYGQALGTGPQYPDLGRILGGILMAFPLSLLAQGLLGVLYVGFVEMTIRKLEGRPVAIGDLFAGFGRFGAVFGASLISAFATWVGLILLLVPGLYLFGALAFGPIIALRQETGSIDALSRSYETLKGGRVFAMFGVLFLAGLTNILGLCACGVGVLVTLPIMYCTIGVNFYNFFPPFAPMPPQQMPWPQEPPRYG